MAKRSETLNQPGLPILPEQRHERVDLRGGDVLLEELSVVVQQRGDRVLGEDVVADLLLHQAERFGDVFLWEGNEVVS